MAIGAALIGGLASLGASAIGSKGRSQNVENDQRETALEEMFSDSFLESLTDSERNALETQVNNTTNTGSQTSTGSQDTTGTGSTTGSQATDSTTNTSGQTDITRGTDESTAAINAILSGANQPDGEAAIQASIARVLESGAPAIANVGNRAGSFDSTVAAQLQNDLALDAARAGAETDLQQQNTNTQNILAAIQAAQAGTEGQAQSEIGTETGTVDTTQDTTNQQSTNTTDQTDSTETSDSTTSTDVTETTQTSQSQQQQQNQSNISDIFTDVDTGSDGIDDRYNPTQRLIAGVLNDQQAGTGKDTGTGTVIAPIGSFPVSGEDQILNEIVAGEHDRDDFSQSIIDNQNPMVSRGDATENALQDIERGTGASDFDKYIEAFGGGNVPPMATRGKSAEEIAAMQHAADMAKFLAATGGN